MFEMTCARAHTHFFVWKHMHARKCSHVLWTHTCTRESAVTCYEHTHALTEITERSRRELSKRIRAHTRSNDTRHGAPCILTHMRTIDVLAHQIAHAHTITNKRTHSCKSTMMWMVRAVRQWWWWWRWSWWRSICISIWQIDLHRTRVSMYVVHTHSYCV